MMTPMLLVGLLALAIVLLGIASFALGPQCARLPRGHYDAPRRFVLTGCASGMGRHVAGTLLRAGHQVCCTDVNEVALVRVAVEDEWFSGKQRVLLQTLDVRSADQWEAAFDAVTKAWGGFDTLINFAGLLIPCDSANITPSMVDAHVDVMLKGVVLGTNAAARRFASLDASGGGAHGGRGGHIVNLSSLGAVAPVRGVSLYQAAKAGVRTFSLAASKDLAPRNVHVSVLLPDAVGTPMVDLQLYHDESALAYSGGILTLAQLEGCLLRSVLPNRPVETRLGASYVRQWGAVFADLFPSSRAVEWAESSMRRKGRIAQRAEVLRRLRGGGESEESRRRLVTRLREIDALLGDGRGRQDGSEVGGAPSGLRGRSRRARIVVVVAAALVAWAALLRVAAHATPADFAKGTLRLPRHPSATQLAVASADEYGSYAGGGFGYVTCTALVTGATSGIGLEAAAALAEAGFTVLLGARSAEAGEAAAAHVNARAAATGRGGSASAFELDLADLGTISRAVAAAGRVLHLLICCAGTAPSPLTGYAETPDGVEHTWGVAHLGHFALASALRPALRRASRHGFPTRVVLVSSEHGHRYFARGGLPDALPEGLGPDGYDPMRAYGVTKLSNILHAAGIGSRWFESDGVAGIAVHPGIVATSLGALRAGSARRSAASLAALRLHNLGVGLWWRLVAAPITEPVASGAASVIHAALSAELDQMPTAYVRHCRAAQPAAPALNRSAAEWLWRESERLVSISHERREAVRRAARAEGRARRAAPPPLARPPRPPPTPPPPPLGAMFFEALRAHALGFVVFYGAAAVAFLGPWATDARGRLGRLKLTAGRIAQPPLLLRELGLCLCSVLVLTCWDVALRADAGREGGARWTRLGSASADSASGARLLLLTLGCAAVGDAHFYFTHRILHAPILYRTVHKAHHASTNPNPLSGLSFHPIESILYFSSLPLAAALLPVPPPVYEAYKWALFLFPIPGHCGFAIRHPALEWLSRNHHAHHTHRDCNFGGLPLLDWLLGTDYASWKARGDA